MDALLGMVLANLIVVGLLACVVYGITRFPIRAALAHTLWLLLLVKLITPPLFSIDLPRISWQDARLDEHQHDQAAAVYTLAESAIVVDSARRKPATLLPQPDPQRSVQSSHFDLPFPVPVETGPPDARLRFAVARPRATNLTATSGSERSLSWQQCSLAVWIAGSTLMILRSAVLAYRFCRLWQLVGEAPREVTSLATRLAHRMRLPRKPNLVLVDARISPMVYAARWPLVVLLPRQLICGLNRRSLELLLAHEIAHIARRDYLVRWLEFVVITIYWWCPLAWWIRSEVRDAEEQCCDSMVMDLFPNTRRAYADTLMDTVEFVCTSKVAASPLACGFFQRGSLKRRLKMLGKTDAKRFTRSARLAVIIAGVIALPLSAQFELQPPSTPDVPTGNKNGGVTDDATPIADDANTTSPVSGSPSSATGGQNFSFFAGINRSNATDLAPEPNRDTRGDANGLPTIQVATVNVARVFSTSSAFKAKTAALKEHIQKADSSVRQRRDNIAALVKQAKDHRSGSARHSQLIREIAAKQAVLKVDLEQSRNALKLAEGKIYLELYKRIYNEIKLYAQENGIDVVLRNPNQPDNSALELEPFDPSHISSSDSQEIIRRINQHVLFVNNLRETRVDITDAIIQRLKKKKLTSTERKSTHAGDGFHLQDGDVVGLFIKNREPATVRDLALSLDRAVDFIDLSGKEFSIGDDGTVVVEKLGPLQVRGKTMDEVKDLIRKAFRQKYGTEPEIEVRITRPAKNRAKAKSF